MSLEGGDAPCFFTLIIVPLKIEYILVSQQRSMLLKDTHLVPCHPPLCTIAENQTQVLLFEEASKPTSKAKKVPPITLSSALGAAVGSDHEEEKGRKWTGLVSPSAGDGSC